MTLVAPSTECVVAVAAGRSAATIARFWEKAALTVRFAVNTPEVQVVSATPELWLAVPDVELICVSTVMLVEE